MDIERVTLELTESEIWALCLAIGSRKADLAKTIGQNRHDWAEGKLEWYLNEYDVASDLYQKVAERFPDQLEELFGRL